MPDPCLACLIVCMPCWTADLDSEGSFTPRKGPGCTLTGPMGAKLTVCRPDQACRGNSEIPPLLREAEQALGVQSGPVGVPFGSVG